MNRYLRRCIGCSENLGIFWSAAFAGEWCNTSWGGGLRRFSRTAITSGEVMAVSDAKNRRGMGHQETVDIIIDVDMSDHGFSITRATNLSTLSVSLLTVCIRLMMRFKEVLKYSDFQFQEQFRKCFFFNAWSWNVYC